MNNYDKHKNENSFDYGSKPNSGMKVPDGYFESFEKSILLQIKEESKETRESIVSINTPKNYKGIVSLLAVAATIIWALMVFTSPKESIDSSPVLTEEVSTDWEVYDMDEYLLAENFTLEEIDEISFEEDYISNQEIYEYVLEENYSEFLLLENL